MITKYLPFARHFVVGFTYGYNLAFVTILRSGYDHFPYFTDLETQSQKNWGAYSELHSL